MSTRGRNLDVISFYEACGLLVMTYSDTARNFETYEDLLNSVSYQLLMFRSATPKMLEERILTEKDIAVEVLYYDLGCRDDKDTLINEISNYLCLQIKPKNSRLTGAKRDEAYEKIREFVGWLSGAIIQGLHNHFTDCINTWKLAKKSMEAKKMANKAGA